MKKIFLFLTLFLIILGSAYTAGWYYFARVIDREVAGFIEDQKDQGVYFDGIISPAHGFPGVYHLVYTGDIRTPAGNVNIPKLEISGIPLEGQEITVLAPLGMTIQSRGLPEHLKKLEQAAMTFEVPTGTPPEFTYPYLKIWQAEGNAHLKIPSLSLQWTDASIFADTEIRLNDDLQPEGEARLGVTNHNFFVTIIAEEIGLSSSKKLMLLTFLNAIDKSNGAVILPFRLQNNAFYLNMIRLGALPIIHWPRPDGARQPFSGWVRPDNPPASRQ